MFSLLTTTAPNPAVDYVQLYRLRLVSRQWLGLIDGTPELWTYISNSFPQPIYTNALRKSSSIDLDVRCVNSPTALDFAGVVVPHAHRWRSLSIASDNTSIFLAFLDFPRSNLQHKLRTLIVSSDIGLSIGGVFCGPAPRLKCVSLAGVGSPQAWSRLPALHDLQSLALANLMMSPHLSELLDLIAASPGLQDLRLNTDIPNYNVSKRQSILLPQLTRFSISQCISQVTFHLLDRLVLPSCTTNFAVDVAFYQNYELLGVIANHLFNIEDHGARLQTLHLYARGVGPELALGIELQAGSTSIRLTLRNVIFDATRPRLHIEMDMLAMVRHLLCSFKPSIRSRTTILEISQTEGWDLGYLLHPATVEFPAITSLRTDTIQADVLRNYLAVPVVVNDAGRRMWMLPRVTEIRIAGCSGSSAWSVDSVCEIVHARRALLPYVQPIRSLHLRRGCVTTGALEWLKGRTEVKRDGVRVWDPATQSRARVTRQSDPWFSAL